MWKFDFLTAAVAWGYRRNSKPRTCAQRNISLCENILNLIQNVDNSSSLRSTLAFMFTAYTSDEFWLIFIRLGESLIFWRPPLPGDTIETLSHVHALKETFHYGKICLVQFKVLIILVVWGQLRPLCLWPTQVTCFDSFS